MSRTVLVVDDRYHDDPAPFRPVHPRSEQGHPRPVRHPGYISTAKHGAHILTAIHDGLAGNSWMPPISDPP